MFNLMRIEWLKIRRRPRTWILVGMIVLIVLAMGILMKNFLPADDPNWKSQLIEATKQLETGMNAPGIPESEKQQLAVDVQLNHYYIEKNINPNAANVWDFVSNASNISLLVGIFACVIAGDIVASEFTWGTVKMLLIRPVSRTKILFAKYLTAVLFGLGLFITLFASAFLFGGLFFGFTGADEMHLFVDPATGQIANTTMDSHVTLAFFMNFVTILMVVTVAFMIGSIFRSSSMSIAISILLLLIGPQVTQLLATFPWAKYLLFANTELMQHIEGPSLYGTTMSFSLIMLAAYFVVFHLVSWLLFTKRDVAA